jgi:VWFA-related protein
VLNDAVLRAAIDLSKRPATRRKLIFIITDGREYGSEASYQDVLRVLLSNGILVYGIGAESAAIPVYNKLSKLHLPKLGYSNILPKYANATGGEIFNEFSQSAIEQTYARAMGDARNQYTLGYVTPATPSTSLREIEVRVGRPSCKTYKDSSCVDVFAKEGYYPAPPPAR